MGEKDRIGFLTQFSKQFEAIGLGILIIAAFLQFQADANHRSLLACRIDIISAELTSTRARILRYQQCISDGTCKVDHLSHVFSEAEKFCGDEFGPIDEKLREKRKVFFILGSLLVVLGKASDYRTHPVSRDILARTSPSFAKRDLQRIARRKRK